MNEKGDSILKLAWLFAFNAEWKAEYKADKVTLAELLARYKAIVSCND